ncbi:MAG: tRNA 4-thiouridine(8) synthase ThiI [Clostridia bacterium]|nr:tRNA 4-thiouridine(8) synthase ThiI [Clostridia bacterium]
MKEIILVKNGELALKGLNRRNFEDTLAKNIQKAAASCGGVNVWRAQSTMYVTPLEGTDIEDAVACISRVFGIAALSRAAEVEKNMDVILPSVCAYLKDDLENAHTFKVNAKRADKKFALKSPEICAAAGEYILKQFPHLTVDVHSPDVTVTIEIRDTAAYLHKQPIRGAGGLPVGTGGRVCVMISGGIDSPVASWMMAKRGLALSAVNFASPPYTSRRAEDKVRDLLRKVAMWSGEVRLHIVPFTEIQEAIRDHCPEDMLTVIMRRYMIKIAQAIACEDGALALVSGESVGQVASQTLGALVCTDAAANMPILRPVIGMDKEEIVEIARRIDTFEISILPFEDCCTVFTPKHPKTKPSLDKILLAETALENDTVCVDDMIERALTNTTVEIIRPE